MRKQNKAHKMKYLYFFFQQLICSLLFFHSSHAQKITYSFSSIDQLDSLPPPKAKIVIPISFGATAFTYLDILPKSLEKTSDISIRMYYSKFPQESSFQENGQKIVNDKRIAHLLKLFPILKTKNIRLELVGQENCENIMLAKKLFHGFLIDYEIAKENSVQKLMAIKAKPLPQQENIVRTKPILTDFGNINNEFAKEVKRKHIGKDSVTYLAFERNIAQWDSVVIVADWTSSMYPYTLQLLIWQMQHAQQSNKILGYVFFNDGDKTPDNQKKIGQIGGIYTSYSPDITEALQKMDECKKNGNGGGDFDENNIEAVLAAIQQFPSAKSIIMISDNYGKIKDLALLPKVNKPVHIILGRLPDLRFLTEDYLQVALQTGGSLHLKNTDYHTIEQLKELLSVSQLPREEPVKKKKKKDSSYKKSDD